MSSKPKPQKVAPSLNPSSCEHVLRLKNFLSESEMWLWAESPKGDVTLWVACGHCERNFVLSEPS